MAHHVAPVTYTQQTEKLGPDPDEILERETQTARTAIGSSYIPISVDVSACDPLANKLPLADEAYEQYFYAARAAMGNRDTAFVTFDGLEQDPSHPNAFQFIRTAGYPDVDPETIAKCVPILKAPRDEGDYEQAIPLVAELRRRGVGQILVSGCDGSERNDTYDASAEHDRIHLFLKAMRATRLFDKVGVILRPNPDIATKDHPKSIPEETGELVANSDFAIVRTAFTTKAYTDVLKATAKSKIDTPIIPALEIRDKTEDFDTLHRHLFTAGVVMPWDLGETLRTASYFEQAALKEAWNIRLGRQLVELGAPGIHIISNNQTRTTERVAQGIRQS